METDDDSEIEFFVSISEALREFSLSTRKTHKEEYLA